MDLGKRSIFANYSYWVSRYWKNRNHTSIPQHSNEVLQRTYEYALSERNTEQKRDGYGKYHVQCTLADVP